jgi:hypothetical protein
VEFVGRYSNLSPNDLQLWQRIVTAQVAKGKSNQHEGPPDAFPRNSCHTWKRMSCQTPVICRDRSVDAGPVPVETLMGP